MSCGKHDLCRNAVESDISSVARIHLAAFDGFFLSQLGHKFLCAMYLAFLKSPGSVFLVYETAPGQLAGFVVGAVQGQKDRWLAVRFFPKFLLAGVPAISRHPVQVVKRLWGRFFETSESPKVPTDAAILRSIGVLPFIRGTGAAASLLKAFENLALKRGAKHVFLTTDEVNNERAQRFYERGGYALVARFQQDGERWMWLISKSLNGSVNE